MRNIICREIDYYKEAIELTYRIVNGVEYDSLKSELLRRLDPVEHETITYVLDTLSRIEQSMKETIDCNEGQIRFYFGTFGNKELCLAKILYQGMSHVVPTEKNKEEQYLYEYIRRITKDESLELSLSSVELEAVPSLKQTQMTFVERVDALNCDDGEKWRLFELVEHVKEHISTLFELLQPIVTQLKQYHVELEALVERAALCWEDYLEHNSFLKLISQFYGITQDSYKERTAYIRIQVMNCNHVTFMGEDENEGEYHILEVGTIFNSNFHAAKKHLTHLEICNGLKVLADPSKFEILMFIKEEKAYGQELALKSNLSTATISHHMNGLMAFGFIDIEKVDNKTYYKMNKEVINNFIEEVKQTVL